MHDCSNSSASAMELLQSCSHPSMCDIKRQILYLILSKSMFMEVVNTTLAIFYDVCHLVHKMWHGIIDWHRPSAGTALATVMWTFIGLTLYMLSIKSVKIGTLYLQLMAKKGQWVSEWLDLTVFLWTVDSKVHIVHISRVIISNSLESLFSLT